jgi:hypothetical protein
MTPDDRLAHLERQVARLRRREAALFTGLAIAVAAFACRDKAEPAQATSIEFGRVRIDATGLTLSDEAGDHVLITARGLDLTKGDHRASVHAEAVIIAGKDQIATVADAGLSVLGAHHQLVAAIDRDSARVAVLATDPDVTATLLARADAGRASVITSAAKKTDPDASMAAMTSTLESARVAVSRGHDTKELQAK